MNKIGNIEYKMPEVMAKTYLHNRKGEDKKKHPQEYLCEVVNNEFGILGTCTRVITY